MAQSHEDVLRLLEESQAEHELSIIKLSDPISSATKPSGNARTSDVSVEGIEEPSPASLEADLTHYKELFSKLRFSYLEQVTKEKFIRSIVGDPPQIVSAQDNIELESQLLEIKTTLKAQKTEVAELVEELGRLGRDLTKRHENIQMQTTQLRELPERIAGLESSIEELKAKQEVPSDIPHMNYSLEKTQALVEERKRQSAELDRQIEQLQNALPRKTRELDRLQGEVGVLESKRTQIMASAKEAKRRREEGGGADELEERGRWYRGVEAGLRGMLEVEN